MLFGTRLCPLFCKNGHLTYYLYYANYFDYVFDCLVIRCSAFWPSKYTILEQYNVFQAQWSFFSSKQTQQNTFAGFYLYNMYCVII